MLPVRIDYGFDQAVPIVVTDRVGVPPSPAELVTPRGYLKALLSSVIGDMLEDKPSIYYVLGDKWRYRFRRRH